MITWVEQYWLVELHILLSYLSSSLSCKNMNRWLTSISGWPIPWSVIHTANVSCLFWNRVKQFSLTVKKLADLHVLFTDLDKQSADPHNFAKQFLVFSSSRWNQRFQGGEVQRNSRSQTTDIRCDWWEEHLCSGRNTQYLSHPQRSQTHRPRISNRTL